MSDQTILVLFFVAGAIARVVLPYLQVWLSSREPFDWRRVIGQVLAAAIVIVPALTNLSDQLASATMPAAVVIGWGAADIGRFGQKVVDRVRAPQG